MLSWNRLVSSCSKVSVDRSMNTIQAEDCLNGTWFQDLGLVDYNTLTRAYLQYRHDPERYIVIG